MCEGKHKSLEMINVITHPVYLFPLLHNNPRSIFKIFGRWARSLTLSGHSYWQRWKILGWERPLLVSWCWLNHEHQGEIITVQSPGSQWKGEVHQLDRLWGVSFTGTQVIQNPIWNEASQERKRKGFSCI